MRSVLMGVLGAAALTTGAARAARPEPAAVEGFVAQWRARTPAAAMAAEMSLDDAYCAQERLLAALKPALGREVGYKAGLTAKPVQARFNATAPVRGVLLEGMLLQSGARLPAGFGARPVWEADLLLVARDDGLTDARTAEEALAHVRGLRPFIELPDLSLAESVKMDAAQLTAINVGARFGAMGDEVALASSAEMVAALAALRIVASDDTGAVLAENTGAATLGSPLAATLWLAENLRDRAALPRRRPRQRRVVLAADAAEARPHDHRALRGAAGRGAAAGGLRDVRIRAPDSVRSAAHPGPNLLQWTPGTSGRRVGERWWREQFPV